MAAKSLILFGLHGCREMVQGSRMSEKSRTWAWAVQLAHKVIHMMCGQRRKHFLIINLGGVAETDPSFRPQLASAAR
jgi:hypothetical protein